MQSHSSRIIWYKVRKNDAVNDGDDDDDDDYNNNCDCVTLKLCSEW